MKRTIFTSILLLMTMCVFGADDETVIRKFYTNCVFGNEYYESGNVSVLRRYCSPGIIKRLRAEYEYDGTGYAVYIFRTATQDSNPDVSPDEVESGIKSITPLGKGWYRVSYTDGGWPGCTDVRVKKGLISDMRKDKSWKN